MLSVVNSYDFITTVTKCGVFLKTSGAGIMVPDNLSFYLKKSKFLTLMIVEKSFKTQTLKATTLDDK